MNKEEIKNRLEEVLEHLESPDIQFQATGLETFNDLASNEVLTPEQLKTLIPFVKKILKEPDSTLKTDCFKTASLIGLKKFNLIEDIFPLLFEELKNKNRFRSKIVVKI